MNITLLTLALLFVSSAVLPACSSDKTEQSKNQNKEVKREMKQSDGRNIYDISVRNMDGAEVKLSDYSGKVIMIVNIASKCGYTKQYAPLEDIYRKYSEKGFVVLGFPCNDFGGQEPGTNDEIRTFCESKFDVTFPLFDKISVLGEEKSPLYERLTQNAEPPGDIDWNFEKFIISKKGDIVARFKSKSEPDSKEVVSVIEAELEK